MLRIQLRKKRYYGTSALGCYKGMAAARKFLSNDEKAKAAEDLRNGSDEKKLAARNTLVLGHVLLAVRAARQFEYTELPVQDLVQEGILGLYAATVKFDPALGKFSTRALPYVFTSIIRYAKLNGCDVHIPLNVQAKRKEVNEAAASAFALYGKVCLVSLGAQLGLEPEEVSWYLTLGEQYSFDEDVVEPEPQEEQDSEPGEEHIKNNVPVLVDEHPTPPEILECKQLQREISQVLATLPPIERHVVQARSGFSGEPLTLEEVSRRLDLTRERVRQIECKVLRKLRLPYVRDNLAQFRT